MNQENQSEVVLTAERGYVKGAVKRYREELEALKFFEKLEKKAGKNWGHYWEAKNALREKVSREVEIVQRLGGLLLIGGKA